MALTMQGATTVVWQGIKTFSLWSDILDIRGSKFSKVKADDVVMFSLTVNGDAKLQVSYGSGWINFAGLEALPVAGDYSMVVTAQMAALLKQGIHVKGTGYTLKAVSIVSNDAGYTTSSADLFAWTDLLTSGATRGETSTVSVMAYGGVGWYWPEPRDLSGFGSIEISLLQPAAEPVIVQLLYGDTGVKCVTMARGTTTCRLMLNAAHKSVYSFNIMSKKAQVVAIGSVNILDKQGNVTAIGQLDNPTCQTTRSYNLNGMEHDQPNKGINIVESKTQGGQTSARKIVR